MKQNKKHPVHSIADSGEVEKLTSRQKGILVQGETLGPLCRLDQRSPSITGK